MESGMTWSCRACRHLRIAPATVALVTDSKATGLGVEQDFSTPLPPSPKTATADEPLRHKIIPYAESQGFLTDDDVFNEISL